MEFKIKPYKLYIISGKAQSGKDTIATIIKEYYEQKNLKVITLAYASYLKEYAKKITNWDGKEETKPRELLQNLGVELIKNNIDKNMLINRIKEDIKVYSYFFDIIIITDARFKEEIENIEETKTVIHVSRNQTNLTEKQKIHKTEISLDEYQNYDYDIKNNGTIEELKIKIIKILEEIKW